jgi:putative NADH-flavin reductase
MKIGVSGASGHLGRAAVSELLQRPSGHEVVAITRTPQNRLWTGSRTIWDGGSIERKIRFAVEVASAVADELAPMT